MSDFCLQTWLGRNSSAQATRIPENPSAQATNGLGNSALDQGALMSISYWEHTRVQFHGEDA
jgi:hypothetical protein